MKRRLTLEQIETVAALPPSPTTVESLRKRRWRLVIALIAVNCICLFNATVQVVTWPSSASLSFSAEQVTVTYDTQRNPYYRATVPLKEFPYDVQLGQECRYDLLSCSLVNLLLLIAILHSYRRQAKLERMPAPQEPCP